jgi:ABC-type Fe3+ transport system permease subunit
MKRWRNIFGVLLVLSLVFVCVLASLSSAAPVAMPPEGSPQGSADNTGRIALVISLLSAVTSFLGFLSTTVLAWRQDRREERRAVLEAERQQLEIDRERREFVEKLGKP